MLLALRRHFDKVMDARVQRLRAPPWSLVDGGIAPRWRSVT